MAKKGPGQRVSIVGVATYQTRKDMEESRKQRKLLSYAIPEGSLYSIGLAYPPPGILPSGESAVAALMVGQDAELFGVTSGKQSHLFWMARPLLVADIGAIAGVKEAAGSLVMDANSVLYGASREKGGPVFSCDTPAGAITLYSTTSAPITMRAAPFKDDGAAGLAISHDRRVIAGVGDRTGRIFLLRLKTGKIRLLPPIAKEGDAFSRVLCAGSDNYFYGSGASGQLFRMSPEGDTEWLPGNLPCRKGKAYVTRASSLVLSRSGRLYGGTEDGYLFSLNLPAAELVSHGRGNDIPDLHALAEGADGAIYGITGRGRWVSHLVRFRPHQAEWTDLGLFESHGHYPWTGFNVGSLVAGREGQLYAGEADRFGHLFIYHPPAHPG